MLTNTTLKGLDEALIELQHAIENIPDGSKKKQLLDRYNRLRQVRNDLENPSAPHYNELPLIIALVAIFSAGLLIYFLVRKS